MDYRPAAMRPLLLAALVALTTAVVVAAGPTNSVWKVEAHGTVKCQAGKHVEGVYINLLEASGDGFAQWHGWDSPDQAKYYYRIPEHAKYNVHVGCGGTREHWATNNKAPVTEWAKADHHPHWLCLNHEAHGHHKIHTCFRTDVGNRLP